MTTIIANEVRSYIEKLRLGEEIEDFLTTHELEINLRLKPLRGGGDKAPPKAPPDDESPPE